MFEYRGTLVRWVDGDTAILELDLGMRLSFTGSFRLMGVDTPERGEPCWTEATAEANRLCPPGCPVTVRTYKSDKYGRWLADVCAQRIENNQLTPYSVGQSLIDSGHGKPYGTTR